MITVRPAAPDDAAALHTLAALTFPLACPPRLRPESVAAFVADQLSAARFADYLADPQRGLWLAHPPQGEPVGYTMLVAGEPADPAVAAAVSGRPTAELNKCYVHPDFFGAGVAPLLVEATLAGARERALASVWLGVNVDNVRAARFYDKVGFTPVGRRRFRVGDQVEEDDVRELSLMQPDRT